MTALMYVKLACTSTLPEPQSPVPNSTSLYWQFLGFSSGLVALPYFLDQSWDSIDAYELSLKVDGCGSGDVAAGSNKEKGRMWLAWWPRLGLEELGASFTQGTVSSIPIVGSISPKGFLPPILLLVVMVVIVAVILVVFVVAIVGVGNPLMKAYRSFLVFGTMFGHKTANSRNLLMDKAVIQSGYGSKCYFISSTFCYDENTVSDRCNKRMRQTSLLRVPVGPVFLLRLLVPAIVAACASRAAVTLSETSFLMAA
ncbi:hypothetical protein Tco_0820066 [Tanacetum coccineum]|uniref:Uncharacterized protein n=1 Tax=Tanacetum coccineum TaxID=301880 RepID=A0ABQ5AB86_9ASTR